MDFFHIVYAVAITLKNRGAKKTSYAYQSPESKKKEFKAKLRPLLGAVIFVFLIIHLKSFWFKASFVGIDDLYEEVVIAFNNIYYVCFYVFAMLFLAYHLAHGLRSGIRTLGLVNPKYMRVVELAGLFFSIIVPLLFSVIPVYIYIAN